MRVWVVATGEPFPLKGEKTRLHRAGTLAKHLSDAGHEVHWWTSDFDHFKKRHVDSGQMEPFQLAGAMIHLIPSPGYQKNVSVQRLFDHLQVGRRFLNLTAEAAQPDVIVCAFPTIELTRAVASLGAAKGIPWIADIRDLWPDVFSLALPRPLRWTGEVLFFPYRWMSVRALSRATALVGISDSYLEWGLSRARRNKNQLDRVIPLGYEGTASTPRERTGAFASLRGRGIDPDGDIAVYVGSMGRSYDLDVVIRAARISHENGDDEIQWIIAGRGEAEAEVRTAEQELPNLFFLGWLDGVELGALLDVSTVGLAPYRVGAFQSVPNKVIEYLSAGLPVISSLGGETQTLLWEGNAGWYFPPGDSEALWSAVRKATSVGSARSGVAERARELFRVRFSEDRVFTEFVNLVEWVGSRMDGSAC